MDNLLLQLNHSEKNERIPALKELYRLFTEGKINKEPVDFEYVNNHIHTTYSFSPYSPSKALWTAFVSGLTTAGIMDHDSVGGINEFIEAGKILNMPVTVGMECRVNMSGSKIANRHINNPDQKGIAYMAVHGIPHTQIENIESFMRPYREKRNCRNKAMVRNINDLMGDYGISLDYETDISPISMYNDGGSITERHLLFALSLKLIKRFGKGEGLIRFLSENFQLSINEKVKNYLLDQNNPYYAYDLSGALKSELAGRFYIPATEECPHVKDVIQLCRQTGAISAYAYLGDVGVSVTGDKKAQRFEDDYLDLLFEELRNLGFNAVTYMPSRNTKGQMRRVKDLCVQYSMLQISGEDINSPRQKFICGTLKDEEFWDLKDTAWALIGHEIAASSDLNKAMFSNESNKFYMDLNDRIRYYKMKGKKSYGRV